jgi:heat shock protein HslJ
MKNILYVAIAVALLCSCSAFKKKTKIATNSPLANTQWVLSSITDYELEQTGNSISLSFQDTSKRFGGYGGCNSYGGVYTINKNNIKMEKIISTKKACIEGMRTEHKIKTILSNTDQYKVTGNTLEFFQNSKLMATFVVYQKDKK